MQYKNNDPSKNDDEPDYDAPLHKSRRKYTKRTIKNQSPPDPKNEKPISHKDRNRKDSKKMSGKANYHSYNQNRRGEANRNGNRDSRNNRYDNRSRGSHYNRNKTNDNNRSKSSSYDDRNGSGGYNPSRKSYDNRNRNGRSRNSYNNRNRGGYNNRRSSRAHNDKYNNAPRKAPFAYEPPDSFVFPAPEMPDKVRLNKYIANAGVCSRRKADKLIRAGKVTINDNLITEMGHRVYRGDVVKLDGEVIEHKKNHLYILLNKPKNVITSLKDEKGRTTVADICRHITKERVYSVGRLDRNTTGLILLTNDGDLAQKLAHPSHGIKKTYSVVLDKKVSYKDMNAIRNTLELEDGPAPVDAINFIDRQSPKTVSISIHIGKNRIVRRIFEHLGYRVRRLDRTMYSLLTKKRLPRGRCRFLNREEVTALKRL